MSTTLKEKHTESAMTDYDQIARELARVYAGKHPPLYAPPAAAIRKGE